MNNDKTPPLTDQQISDPTHPTPPGSLPPAQSQQHDYLHPIQDGPKKTYHPKRMTLILSIIVAMCVLAVGVMVWYAFIVQSVKPADDATKKSSSVTTDTLTAKKTIENVNVYFKGAEKAKTAIDRPVKAPGKNFYTVIPDVEPLTSLAGPIPADKSAKQIESIERSLDYDKFDRAVFSDGKGQNRYLADFVRTDVICQLDVTKPADPKAEHWFEVRCLDMSQYSDYANAQQTFANLYSPLTASTAQYGFVGKPAPRDGGTASYHLLEIPVSSVINDRLTANGHLALFYQTPDGLWFYFRDRDQGVVVECDHYTTDAQKYAYNGSDCRDPGAGTLEKVEAPKYRR